jgi:hypothetical protein
MTDVRKIQETLYALGYVSASGFPLKPFLLHRWAYDNGVSAPVLDSALGWQQGTTTKFVIDHRLAHLTGDTGVNAPPPHPPRSEYGSGFQGTAAAPAGPAGLHNPAIPIPAPAEIDRKTGYLWYFKNARWKIPGDELSVAHDLRRLGVTPREAETWLGLAPGTLDPWAPISAQGGGGPVPVK